MRISTRRPRTVRAALVAAAFGTALLTAACGSSTGTSGGGMDHSTMPSSAAAPGTNFNNADVTFATQMIQHHRQALQMAQLAQTKAATATVKDLAARISKEQQPEITIMSGWLTSWGKPVPAASSTPGMGTAMPMPDTSSTMPGMGNMPGMMSGADMKKLDAANGTAFDKMFLTMMITHHQGAVQMATTEQAQGANPTAKRLAGDIASSQTAEITEMRGLLSKL